VGLESFPGRILWGAFSASPRVRSLHVFFLCPGVPGSVLLSCHFHSESQTSERPLPATFPSATDSDEIPDNNSSHGSIPAGSEDPGSTTVAQRSRLIASGSEDATVKIWDPEKGQCVSTLEGHTRKVVSVDWSPDATRVVSGSHDSTIRIWHPTVGLCLSELSTPGQERESGAGEVNAVAWSHSTAQLASATRGGTVEIWDPATGQHVRSMKHSAQPVRSVAWSHEAARVASGSDDGTIRIWDSRTSRCVITLGSPSTEWGGLWGKKHVGGIRSVAWSRDAVQLASSAGDATIKIWDVRTGHGVSVLEDGLSATLTLSVAWSPDTAQPLLASGSGWGTTRIWDPGMGERVSRLTRDGIFSFLPSPVSSVAWSYDAGRLASAHGENINIWDPATGQWVSALNGHSRWVRSIAWSAT
jgi:WD40 repeat protein